MRSRADTPSCPATGTSSPTVLDRTSAPAPVWRSSSEAGDIAPVALLGGFNAWRDAGLPLLPLADTAGGGRHDRDRLDATRPPETRPGRPGHVVEPGMTLSSTNKKIAKIKTLGFHFGLDPCIMTLVRAQVFAPSNASHGSSAVEKPANPMKAFFDKWFLPFLFVAIGSAMVWALIRR